MAEQATQPLARIEQKIDRQTSGSIMLSTRGGMLVNDVGQAMEVAKLMAISGAAVPSHIRNNPGICLAVALQAWEWSMNPYAVANKSYVVNDRLAYESALYNAVATQRAPIIGRLKIAYTGKGPTRQCTVSARLDDANGGEVVDYQSPELGAINPKNSPLWKNDPDQQLFYFSARAFVRRHFPDVMMGVYTVDELQDAGSAPVPTPTRREAASINVEAVLGAATEQTTQPGGTAETAPQPKDKGKKAKAAAEAPKPEAPKPEPQDDPAPAPAPDAKPAPTPAPDAAPAPALSIADQIRTAWGAKLKASQKWDTEPHPDIVEAQLEQYCQGWATCSWEEVVKSHPGWLPKLLKYITDDKIPATAFSHGLTPPAEAKSEAEVPAPAEEEPAEPKRPGRKST